MIGEDTMALTQTNFTIEQGEDLVFTLKLEDSDGLPLPDLADAKFRMDVKKQPTDTHPVWAFQKGAEVEVDYDGPEGEPAELDTTDDVTINAETGEIHITVDRAFTFKPAVRGGGTFSYDAFLDRNDKRRKILTGTITVNKSVTIWED